MQQLHGREVSRTLRVGVILLIILSLSLQGATAAPGGKGMGQGLSKHDRELVVEARANGKDRITLLIASKPGANRSVISGVESLGGKVQYRDDDVGYLRVEVAIDQAEAVAALSGVEAVDVDEIVPLEDPRPEPGGAVDPTPQTPPGSTTPNNNPYMPIGEAGASQFMTANPTWDGRGTTVGIIDTGVDLDHPALQTTTTSERKIVDWKTATDPVTDNDPTWVNMQDQVSGASFTYKDVTYTAPADSIYRIGLFDERDPRLGGEVGSDVNRDGNPDGSSGIFAVLWNTDTNTVYVDTDQNNSFDKQGMTDYTTRYDVGTFGTDNLATEVREAMPFVVQTDGKNKVINIGIVSGAHGSHVGGIVAANGMFGGAMSGAAPGAKLVSIRVCLFVQGCTAHALIEGMIYAAKQANVDVINMSIGGLPALNDGNNTRAVLYNRLIEQYKVQMFISAGNSGPGMNTVGDPSVASKVVSVGSYITKATWQSNYGSDSAHEDNLHYYSSRGPREDGGFKPQIVAPGSAISTVPTWQAGGPVAGTYDLPAGYAMFNGTSMASPQAAGAAALLVSAALQAGAQHQPDQLRQAMLSSARLLDTNLIQVYEQGNGLIDVGAAWDLLKTNIKTVAISSSVPVDTVLSRFLADAGMGQGIFIREGLSVDDEVETRQYTFTRTSGGSKAITYNLSWGGNDGTFRATFADTQGQQLPTDSISLPLNKPVRINVDIVPTTPGVHSAILNLDDPATAGIDYQTMNVVVAADQFTAENSYTVTKSGTVERNQMLSFFFNVPAGTPAFNVAFSGPSGTAGTGQARFLRFHPYGVGIDSNSSLSCYNPSVSGCGTGNPDSRTASNPQAGVWEVTVDARRTSDTAEVPFKLTASILGASVEPNPDVIESATIGTPVARSYTVTNLFGAFNGGAVGTALGSAYQETPTIEHHEVQEFFVDVTEGSTSLRATIGGTSDKAADLDLFIYDCTAGADKCIFRGQSADGDSEESVTINTNVKAGQWKVVVDGYAVPAGSTTFNYLDVFANPAFGSVSITDAGSLRPAGSSWTVPGAVTANAAPAEGRVLLGSVEVRTDGDILVGSGDVVIQNVSR